MPKRKASRTKKDTISRYMAEIGAKGGKTKGKAKARPSELMRQIALENWAKKKAAKRKEEPPPAED